MHVTLKNWILIAIIFAAGLAYIAKAEEPASFSVIQSSNNRFN